VEEVQGLNWAVEPRREREIESSKGAAFLHVMETNKLCNCKTFYNKSKK
jgi:hypothetical protein